MSELHRLALRVQLAAFPGRSLDSGASRLLADGLGGICLFGSNTGSGPDAVARLVGQIHAAGDGPVVAIDEEGGDVTRLHARTGSPSPGNAVLGVVDDVELTRDTARSLGAELASLGIGLDLAPVADVNSSADNPIIGVRSFGAEPHLVARHVAAWVTGLQSAGVSACAKHFPGHGDTAQDSHTDLPRVDASLPVLQGRELVPFAAAVGASVDAVMTSHLVLGALDADRPATLSPMVLDLLRAGLGFGGAIVTDALDMAGVSGNGRGVPEAAVQAVCAGADLLCLGADKDVALVESVRDALVDAVRSGRLPESRLHAAALRVDALARSRPARADLPVTGDSTAAARRALRVDGILPLLAGALVVRVDTAPSIAVGAVPWGLAADVAVDPERAGAVEEVLRTANGRALLVQVRDLHRHPQVAGLVTRIALSRADAVLVEWGWPSAPQPPLTRICTYGASTASRDALEQLLRESTGWTP